MNSVEDYKAALRVHLQTFNSQNPLPEISTLNPLLYRQHRHIGGSIVSWLQGFGQDLLEERNFLAETLKQDEWEQDPAIIIISDVPGLLAAREIIVPSDDNQVLWASQAAMESFYYQDDTYKFHVTFSSSFSRLIDGDLFEKANEKHHLENDDTFYIHQENSDLGKLFGRYLTHLWKWDKNELKLLEEGFEYLIS